MSPFKQLTCNDVEDLLVDYVDGVLSASLVDWVELHCASCRECGAVVLALREVPARLRAEADASATECTPAFWEGQRQSILARIGEIEKEESARNRGFDVRILLPLAAALLIALAGIVSLQSLGGGRSGTRPARAALGLSMEDPVVTAELADALGEPLVFSDRAWSEVEIQWDGGPWHGRGLLDTPPALEDLDETEIVDLEEILGVEIDV